MPSALIPNVLAALLLSASAAAAAERATVAAVAVEKTAFIVTLTDGSVLKGPQLAGSMITVALPGGGQAEIRIDSVEPDPADPDITLYGLSGRDSATGGPWRGSRTKNVDPLPASLSTEIVPPSAAVSWRQIARPSPVPLPRPLVV